MISVADVFRGLSWRLGVLAGLIAVPLSLGVFWAWESFSSPPPGRREGASFQIVEGRGEITAAGFRIPQGADASRVIVATALPAVRARVYGSMIFDIEGLDAAQGAGIYFTRRQDPSVGHPRALSLGHVRQRRIEMSEDPRWIGEIEVLGFIIQGPLSRDIVIRSVTLLPRSTGFWDVVARLGGSWSALADWDAGSANFYVGASVKERLITPTVFIGLWVLFSCLVYLLILRYGAAGRPRVDGSSTLSVLLLALMVGWSALDARWQLDVLSRLQSVDSTKKLEREAARRWAEVRQRSFQSGSRVFIVSPDPNSYQVVRTRYDLAGVNASMGLNRLPSVHERRVGDFLIFLGDRQGVRFNAAISELEYGSEAVKAKIVFDDPLLGALLRIIA